MRKKQWSIFPKFGLYNFWQISKILNQHWSYLGWQIELKRA